METNAPKKRTITLSGRPPVKIVEEDWPEIAVGSRKDWDGQYDFQANRTWKDFIRVRQHEDGRAIVYGVSDYDTLFQGEKGYCYKAGKLLTPGEDIPSAIYTVANHLAELGGPEIELNRIAEECIADLPAEEI